MKNGTWFISGQFSPGGVEALLFCSWPASVCSLCVPHETGDESEADITSVCFGVRSNKTFF